MKLSHKFGFFFSLIVLVGLLAPARGAVVDVTGNVLSNQGQMPAIIQPPTDAVEDCVVSGLSMKAFDEAQGVTTTQNFEMDNAVVLPAGSRVDSHMIFLNTLGSETTTHFEVIWTFDKPILGVMSDMGGFLEAASSAELGNPNTNYTDVINTTPCGTNEGNGDDAAPFPLRGLEQQNGCVAPTLLSDGYSIMGATGNQLKVCMLVNQPGDWIRVITDATPPPDSDSCEDGRPEKLVFQYTGETCSASNNTQTGDTCAGGVLGADPVRIVYTDKFANKITVTPSTQTVKVGDLVTLEATGRPLLHANTTLEVRRGGNLLQRVRIHTSCSQPLNLGDQFGSLVLWDYIAP